MSLFEELRDSRMISYLDLYIYAGQNGHLQKPTQQKCNSYSKDVIFGFPQLDTGVVLRCLKELGFDTRKEIEEKVCFHRPLCMQVHSAQEDKPIAYGLAYFGLEREDREWREFKEAQ